MGTVRIRDGEDCFAAILGDGTVVTWGNVLRGVVVTAVPCKEQLKNVQHIQASGYAFADILGDGSVVTWGPAHGGGDSSPVQDQLKNVQQIQASRYAFAAVKIVVVTAVRATSELQTGNM